jgi:N-acetylglucosamine-6-phosphate deacetylase
MRTTALAGARLFDGSRWHEQSAVLMRDGVIVGIVLANDIPPDTAVERVDGGVLAPGFIDAQVNGGGGILLNDAPTAEAMNGIWAAHRAFGTCRLMPTLVTSTAATVETAFAATRRAGIGILGLHLEGPHLSAIRRGVHNDHLMRPMTDGDVDRLLSAGVGRLVVTVAVEQIQPAQVRRLVDGGVVVSIGHSDASYEQAMALVDSGASGVTHLFNAMSPLQSRAPGLLGAALEAGALWCGFIADGIHVAPAALRIALRAKRPPGRLFLVTDAMPSVGSTADSFTLEGRVVNRRGNRLTWKDEAGNDVLAGAHLDMASAVRFCVEQLELPLEEALRMASLYPATFLRLDGSHGSIAPGYAADIVHLDGNLQVRRTWVAGASAPA